MGVSQSNDNAECVSPENRFNFVDDLTILEKVNLLIIGLATFNCQARVPSDTLRTLRNTNILEENTGVDRESKNGSEQKENKSHDFQFHK